MKIHVAWIQTKPGRSSGRSNDKSSAVQSLTTDYLRRIARYSAVDSHELRDEAALLKLLDKSRLAPMLVLLDSRGRQLASEELAKFIENQQMRATPQILFAVGGADGFSPELRCRADFELSLGKMTFPHELARVILLEQLYRAFTILKGHPYHLGH